MVYCHEHLSILIKVPDWMMFTAATVSDKALRDSLVTRLHAYASPNLENQPYDVVYNTYKGNQITGASRSYIYLLPPQKIHKLIIETPTLIQPRARGYVRPPN